MPKPFTKTKCYAVPILFLVEAESADVARIKIEAALASADEEHLDIWKGWGVIERAEIPPNGVAETNLH